MKNWISKNFKTLIIAAFLIPIVTVAIVSISHVTKWYGISNPITWSVYLSIGVEIAALSALAAISANMGKKVYFPFMIVTIIQFIGNIFFAYSYIDVNGQSFKDWVGLVSPLVEFMGVEPTDFIGHKRFLAFFAGGMLPIISLSFLHMLVKFTEEERMKVVNDVKNEIDPSEIARIHLTEKDLNILQEALFNPPPPTEALQEAAKKYREEKTKQRESLVEMMKNDEEMGLYGEPFDNPLVKEPSTTPQNASEMMITTDEDIIESIPLDDEVSDWDVTLMDGLENEEPFFTEEELVNIFQEEPTIEDESINFSTITPEMINIFQEEFVPSLSDDEIMEMNQDEYERKLDMNDFFIEEINEIKPPTIEEQEPFDISVEIVPDDEPVYQSDNKEIDDINQIMNDVINAVDIPPIIEQVQIIDEPIESTNEVLSENNEEEELKKKV